MTHEHIIRDSDPHFSIDPISRAITNSLSGKTTLMQFDHNSERFTFEVPRYIEGHDMSISDAVQVHYINIEGLNSQNTGVYEADDVALGTSEDGEEVVTFSWLISQNATQLQGSVNFLVRFICSTDGEVDYIWSSDIYKDINIAKGINNGEEVVSQYADILEQWRDNLIGADARLDAAIDDFMARLNSGEFKGEKGDPGYTPQKGIDYFDGEKGDPGYTPRKDVDYFDGAKGDPGYTPQKGIDYFDGEKGDPGDRGIGIESIILTDGNHAAGTVDTYLITYSDGSTTTFTVYNGANGEGAGDMTWTEWKTIYDPQNKMADIFAQEAITSWDDIPDKPEFFDGDYNSLENKPTIPTVPTAEISANTSARHTHNNKGVLDSIDEAKVASWNAKANTSDIPTEEVSANTSARHTHDNKAVLDGVTAAKVSEWDNKAEKSEIPDAVTDSHINDLIDAKLGVIENGSY